VRHRLNEAEGGFVVGEKYSPGNSVIPFKEKKMGVRHWPGITGREVILLPPGKRLFSHWSPSVTLESREESYTGRQKQTAEERTANLADALRGLSDPSISKRKRVCSFGAGGSHQGCCASTGEDPDQYSRAWLFLLPGVTVFRELLSKNGNTLLKIEKRHKDMKLQLDIIRVGE